MIHPTITGRKNITIKQKGITVKDERRSVCSDCRYGIFSHHVAVWTPLGLMHDFCKDSYEVKDTT